MSKSKTITLLLGIVLSFTLNLRAQKPALTMIWDNDSTTLVYPDDFKSGDGSLLGQASLICKAVDNDITFQYGTDETEEHLGESSVSIHKNQKVLLEQIRGYFDVTVEYDFRYNCFYASLSEHTTHTISDTEQPTEPTCTTTGRPGKCSGCGQSIWDETTTTDSTDYKPVLGHDFADQTWTADEENGGKYRTCTRTDCGHRQYTYDPVPGEPALGIKMSDGDSLTYPQSMQPVYAGDGAIWKVTLGEATACELTSGQIKGIFTEWPHSNTAHQCADKSWTDGCAVDGCLEGRTKRWLMINGVPKQTTETTGDLIVTSLTLGDVKGYECEAEFTANSILYESRMSNQWRTLCLPFETQEPLTAGLFKFYELQDVKEAEIVLKEMTGNIPAGTPVLMRSETDNEYVKLQSRGTVVTSPGAGSAAKGVSLVGRFTASDALPADSYIISGDKFWRVGDLNATTEGADVKVGAFRAYLETGGLQGARLMNLSVTGDETTSIVDALNDLTDGEAECYDLGGKRQADLQRGVNIVKRNGKTIKVIIK